MIARFLILFFVLVIIPLPARALYDVCGDGVDQDGAGGDQACPSPDADGDLYPSSNAYTGPFGAGVIDCDDTNREIFPGAWTNSGCSSNQFRKCNSDGSYSSCLAYSTLAAGDIDGSKYTSLYFCDPTKTADTGTGAWGSPLNCLAFVKPTMSTYHAPAAGDFIIVLGTGAFTQTWSDSGTTRMFYWTSKAGSSSHPIGWFWSSGSSITGQGVDASPGVANTSGAVTPWRVSTGSHYWNVWNLTVNGGYSTSGILQEEATNGTYWNPKAYNIDGREDDNLAGMKIAVDADTTTVYGGTFYDNYERDDTAGVNNTVGIVVIDSSAYSIYSAVAYNTGTAYGYAFKAKHTKVGAAASVWQGVKASKMRHGCLDVQSEETTAKNFIFADCNNTLEGRAIKNADCDSVNCRFKNFVVQDGTIVNSSALVFIPDNTYNGVQSPALTLRRVVVSDDRASGYPTDGSDGFIALCHYCSNALYTDVYSGGKISINNNCYYNQNSVALFFTLWGDAGSGASGATYSSFANWVSGSGFDANSYSENPSLDSYGRAQSANCSDKGWNQNLFAQVTTPAQNGGHGCRMMRNR